MYTTSLWYVYIDNPKADYGLSSDASRNLIRAEAIKLWIMTTRRKKISKEDDISRARPFCARGVFLRRLSLARIPHRFRPSLSAPVNNFFFFF